jgi:hypothetical protein
VARAFDGIQHPSNDPIAESVGLGHFAIEICAATGGA